MSFSISFINMAAARAALASVGRVNRYHFDAHLLRFVFNKASQLEERPARQCSSLRLANRYPVADVRQVFQRNAAVGVFGFFYNGLADIVVGPGSEATFFASQFFQTATCRLCTLGLQLSAQLPLAIANRLDRLALVNRLVTIDGDIRNAHVNAQKLVNVLWSWLVNVAGRKQVEFTVNQAQVRFTTLMDKHSFVVLTRNKAHALATVNRPYRNLVFIHLPGQDTGVVRDRPKRLEGALSLAVKLVGVSHFGDTSNDNLSGQVKQTPNVVVDQLVNRELPKGLRIPSLLAYPIARSIGRLKGTLQAVGLCIGRLEFYFRCQFHGSIVTRIHYNDKSRIVLISQPVGWLQFLPRLKPMGLLEGVL